MGSLDLARWLIVLCSLLSACSSHQENGTATKTGILQGTVTIGPLRPGPVRIGDDNSGKATELFKSHKIAILASDGETSVATAEIDRNGRYEIKLPAGKYFVEITPNDIGVRKLSPSPVQIEAGKTTTLDLDIDTGMR